MTITVYFYLYAIASQNKYVACAFIKTNYKDGNKGICNRLA
jgi:hypothetical protein